MSSALAIIAGYLIGAIPFAYLLVRGLKGIDIRTVGSGNVGATNAGRVLGFRYFLVIFALDVSKGLLPTWGLPRLVEIAGGSATPGLPVLVALATILGHNFPIYLRFRGGKGVATSLGALLALDPVSCAAAGATFLVVLLATRYVSLSSVLGGIALAAVHFARVDQPWARDQIALSLVIILLLGMLIVRHKPNFARIASGTESKVTFRKGKGRTPPSGRIVAVGVIALALLGSGSGVAWYAARPSELDCGALALETVARIGTGHQRAERIAFADAGRLLAVICPRYNRVVLYRVREGGPPVVLRDIELEGRPVSLWPARDRLYVLQRPPGDARHVQQAWWEEFDFRGERLGSKVRIGFDPDDLVVGDDGRTALVLLSGHAEGETNRPDPSLVVLELAAEGVPRVRSQVVFDRPGDDPLRLAFRAGERPEAAVSLKGSNEIARIDLSDLNRPRLIARRPLPDSGVPGPLTYGLRGELLVSESEGGALWNYGINDSNSAPTRAGSTADALGEVVQFRAGAEDRTWTLGIDPRGSTLDVLDGARSAGRLPLRGRWNLGSVRPTSLAYAPGEQGGLVAVSDRNGGLHLIELRERPGRSTGEPAVPPQ